MKTGIHLKLTVGIVVVFGLLLAGFCLWTPLHLKYYKSKLNSPNPAEIVDAMAGLHSMGEVGIDVIKEKCIPRFEKDFRLKRDVAEVLSRGSAMDVSLMILVVGSEDEAKYIIDNWHPLMESGYALSHLRSPVFKEPYIFAFKLALDGATKESAGNLKLDPKMLQNAIQCGSAEIVGMLVKAGVDVDARVWQDRPVLEYAVRSGNSEIVRHLLEGGADTNVRGWQGRPVLEYAIRASYQNRPRLEVGKPEKIEEIIRLLLEKGADPDVLGWQDRPMLEFAVKTGRLAIVKLFVEHGADVNIRCWRGSILNHTEDVKIREYLIVKGAMPGGRRGR